MVIYVTNWKHYFVNARGVLFDTDLDSFYATCILIFYGIFIIFFIHSLSYNIKYAISYEIKIDIYQIVLKHTHKHDFLQN